jgi:hypothetical protein
MAPKTFYRFRKLPIELRLRIWNLMMEPRVIRAKWENEFNEQEAKQVFVLAAGPAPKVLHVCKESRKEIKRKYCLVKSHLPFIVNMSCSPNAVWVNFDIDTLYFVNIPAMPSFLSYMRRLSKKRIGGANKNIKRIAIHANVLDRITNPQSTAPSKLPYLYELAIQQPSIEKIIIMLDNSKFEDDRNPDTFSLATPKPLRKGKIGGGRWGSVRIRSKMDRVFGEFFTKPEGTGKEIEKFKKFKEDHSEWVAPTFMMLSITKTAKHDYAGDGLPIESAMKK